MPVRIELYDTVAVTGDIPQLGLTAGEVGAVVMVYDGGAAFEVEFCDGAGTTYGLHALKADQIVSLHNRGKALARRDDAA